MAQIKVNELSGTALDWCVAKCKGVITKISNTGFLVYTDKNIPTGPQGRVYEPSKNWAQGGPIIDREMREFGFDLWSGAHVPAGQFAATYCRGAPDSYLYGPTALIAAMRCYVTSKLGDTVEVPNALIK